MANNHLVQEGRQIPPAAPWLSAELGITIEQEASVDALFFERFGTDLSAIALLPESLASQLPPANKAVTRGHADQSTSGDSYSPPTRKPRIGVERGERTIGIENIACQEVSLRVSTTRVSSWGVNLELLKREAETDFTQRAFFRWLTVNGMSPAELSPEASALLHAAYTVALFEKTDVSRTFKAPRLPLIHNQRCGLRYRLHFDRAKMGSPCDLHVLLYPHGRKPMLYGVPAVERPTAGEHKAGLAILQTWDKRIRFYQLTDSQWAEWTASKPHLETLPGEVKSLVDHGIAAAEALRASTNRR